ncbi:mandelate racemase/muconate lactonizing enzyme family protein [Spirosoma endbachense]|uniref:Mandelate racemase/muconate lactonizing enzyme family protein n=1 Tax=Spirosoma endbachense TaxID=2666025 RepID=A0A6P1W6C3_9BACT|nr:mandelate racemase/muconate lactonizing enzyme family protein [Spirosoma endbachense]QHW00119.1 mandelate racemase/muconate lactonizing enzyme family protein [Spirosoma endbachense]
MKTNRRHFLSSAMAGGLGMAGSVAALGGDGHSDAPKPLDLKARYAKLDEALKRPVLKKELFPSPVMIETMELLRDRENFIVRVRSKDGAEGIAVGHTGLNPKGGGGQSVRNWPLTHFYFTRFEGKDARDLEDLIPDEHGKSGGVPTNVVLATVELAILDMMGNTIKKPIGALIGNIVNPMVNVYQGSRITELLSLPPEQSLEIVKKDLEETKAKAIKMRVGGPGQLDQDSKAGNLKLIKMARETFGDKIVLGCDGNNKFTVEGGIRMGKILEEYNYQWWEEMVPYGWYDELKMVKDGLKIPIFTGESEAFISTFRWLIANDACDVVQPDQLYFGGLIRSMKVARMAEVFGKTLVPHITQYGLGYLYMLHFISACPNAGKYQEFDTFNTRDANGNKIPIVYKSGDPITSYDGVLKVPTGSGMGITIDPDYIKTHTVVKDW